jgi:hypothetical protein
MSIGQRPDHAQLEQLRRRFDDAADLDTLAMCVHDLISLPDHRAALLELVERWLNDADGGIPIPSPTEGEYDIVNQAERTVPTLEPPTFRTWVTHLGLNAEEGNGVGRSEALRAMRWTARVTQVRKVGGDCLNWFKLRYRQVQQALSAPPEGDDPQEDLIPGVPASQARHSSDFRSVAWFGVSYSFTATQAACVKVLWREWDNGTPEIGEDATLEDPEVEADAKRLIDVFRDRRSSTGYHPAWGSMIVQGSTKGAYRLNPPEKR